MWTRWEISLVYLDWIQELDKAMEAGAENLEETSELGW